MNINKNYWAIIGWYCNGNGHSHRGFQIDACLTTTTVIHHVAFINDIVVNAAQGYDANDCGYGSSVPGNGGDYMAVVGSIAQNANGDSICLSALDFVGPANADANAGTHTAFIGNFVFANSNNFLPGNCTASDGEGMMLDSMDVHGYGGQVYIRDNITYTSSWAGLQIFQQSFNSSSPVVYVANNTFYGNLLCPPFSSGSAGEINLQINGNFPWTINTYKNIALTNVGGANGTMKYGTSCGSTTTTHAYAMLSSGGASVTITTGGTGIENIFKSQTTSCDNGSNCAGGGTTKDVIFYNSSTAGTNTYVDPAFTNTSDLLTNWQGVPSCSSFANVAACMGWNYGSQTATSLTPINDLTPTAGGTSGKGYRPPAACAADSLWPAWLDYITYLSVSGGSSILLNQGLVNKPCNV